MRLGTRWVLGAEPPARLPDAVVAAIRTVEQDVASAAPPAAVSDAPRGSDASARRWTLTWLEGRPVVELDPATGSGEMTVIRFNPTDGTASIASGDSGEERVEEEL
jgi:hypothetical protein